MQKLAGLVLRDRRDELEKALKSSPASVNQAGKGDVSLLLMAVPNRLMLCALLSDQTAKCWGTYIFSVDAGATARTTPVFVRNSNDTANLSNVTQIATKGPSSTCLVIGAEVSCFGSGAYGRLGNGVETDMPLPTLIKYPN